MGIRAMYDAARNRKDEWTVDTWVVTFTVDGRPDRNTYHNERDAIHTTDRLKEEQASDVVIRGPGKRKT